MESITLMFHELKPIFSSYWHICNQIEGKLCLNKHSYYHIENKLLLLQCWLRENDYFIGIVYQLVIDYIDVTGSFKKDYFYEM